MKTLGTLTAVLLAAGAVGGAFVAVKSIPDIKRYLRIRSM